jgi:5-hydroxyisourate hydrolase
MSTLSTHVLDTALGKPASGVSVAVEFAGKVISSGTTDADGRFRHPGPLETGDYRLVFDVTNHFTRTGRDAFYREIIVQFRIAAGAEHYHVPLLLSPFGYSTYRGS